MLRPRMPAVMTALSPGIPHPVDAFVGLGLGLSPSVCLEGVLVGVIFNATSAVRAS